MKTFNKTTRKLFLFILVTGLIPLIIFSVFSIHKSRDIGLKTARQNNEQIARQVAGRIEQYLHDIHNILFSLSEILGASQLTFDQQSQILRNNSTHFNEFNYFRILTAQGKIINSSELVLAPLDYSKDPLFQLALQGQQGTSEVFMSEKLIPTIRCYFPILILGEIDSILVAEIDLLHLWLMVQNLKIGENGFVNLLTSNGHLFASGNGHLKIDALQMKQYPYYNQLLHTAGAGFETNNPTQNDLVTWVKQEASPFWFITVHQPVEEAYAFSYTLINHLIILAIIFILLMFFISWILGHQYIVAPLLTLLKRIHEISRGDLRGKAKIAGDNEFSLLAETLNDMSEKIIEREQEIVQNETQAALGRMAKGLAHDIKHPFTTIEMYTRALEEKHDDPEFRKLFIATVKKEFRNIHAFLENLTELSQNIPHHPIEKNISLYMQDYCEQLKIEIKDKNIELVNRIQPNLFATLDDFSFNRALNNLTRNACEAMKDGGALTLELNQTLSDNKDLIKIIIQDTGMGIHEERLANLFYELKTTKKTGLGIGLTLTHKIIRQHLGEMSVHSTIGVGTRFEILLPLLTGKDAL